MSTGPPKVSVLVLHRGGQQRVDACLSSLEAQTYPRDRFQIDVVDAGSRGAGFAYNAAIRSSSSDFVALVTEHARVAPRWLTELVSAADRHHASAVASSILDWAGEKIDFAGGGLSFLGHPVPFDFGTPPTRATGEERLLFPSQRSVLFSRAAFLEVGGFDEDFFACLEDVDLGWRLNLLGHTIVLAPQAVTYLRVHSSEPPWAEARRLRLLERNALAMIYKNYEAGTLVRVLPAAISLSLLRGLTNSGIDTLDLALSSRPSAIVDVAPGLVAHLIALEDFCGQLPALRRKRELIQNQRRCRDVELFGLFGDPLRLHEIGGPHQEIARVLIHDFRIDEIFEAPGPKESRPVTVKDSGRGLGRAGLPRGSASTPPKVSIVILTALGATHLPDCLMSLREQTYPSDRVEVIVVDNSSANDPTGDVQRLYPGARTILNRTNRGFAAGNNVGASVATGDYLVFLNDDTRVDSDFLHELVETALRRGAAAVASRILDWSGTRIDFVDGAVNFQGKGFQLNYDAPADSLTLEEKPLLFACGCAMLIDRAVFLEAGKWDEGTFAYYEDVELGWRLNLLGHAVWFAPRSVVYHKHHGTSGQWAEPPRIRLYERNSLRMLYELLELESLERVLPATLLLAADRALLGTALSRATDAPAEAAIQAARRRLTPKSLATSTKAALRARGVTRTTPIGEALKRLGIRGFLGVAQDVLVPRPRARTPERRAAYSIERGEVPATLDSRTEPLPIDAAAMLSGVYGFLSDLPELTRRRADVQGRRRATDQAIVDQFGTHWRQPCPARFQHEHNQLHAALVDAFALAGVRSPRTTDQRERDASVAYTAPW